MGSFTELVYSVQFLDDTPQEIVGAFVEFADDASAHAGLPTLEQTLGADRVEQVLLWEANDASEKAFRAMKPIEQAVLWRDKCQWGENAYFPGAWQVSLSWRYEEYWALTVRSYPKSIPYLVAMQLAPLGQFVGYQDQEEPQLIGYMRHEESERPVLIWSDGGMPLRFEDLGENMNL